LFLKRFFQKDPSFDFRNKSLYELYCVSIFELFQVDIVLALKYFSVFSEEALK